LLLDVGRGNDLGGQMKPLAEEVQPLGGQSIVIPLPRELGLEVAAGGEGLARLDDLEDILSELRNCCHFAKATHEEVLKAKLGVSGLVVLLGNKDTLTEEVFVDFLTIGLGDKPGEFGQSRFPEEH